MWPNPLTFCYDQLLLNCYQPPLCYPFHYPPLQNYVPVPHFPQGEESPGNAQKSYRETVEEIEEKQVISRCNPRRKRIEKSRFIIKKEKEDNFERKKQKKDRNLPSNICKYFVSYLYKHPHPSAILHSPSNPNSGENVKACIQQLKKHVKSSQTYIRPVLIEAMCRDQLMCGDSSSTLRVLFKRYMMTEFRMTISMTSKLTKKEKVTYFKLGKKLVRKFTCGE